jgi:hypothetical protein
VSKCTAEALGVGAAVGVCAVDGRVLCVGVWEVGGVPDGVMDGAERAAEPVECAAGAAVDPPPVVQAARAESVSAASGSAVIRRMSVSFLQMCAVTEGRKAETAPR